MKTFKIEVGTNDYHVYYDPDGDYLEAVYVSSDRHHVAAPIDLDGIFVSIGFGLGRQLVSLENHLTERARQMYLEDRQEQASSKQEEAYEHAAI